MYSEKLSDFLYLIDLMPADLDNLISSYVLKADKVAVIESGPLISADNLLSGLKEIGVKNKEVDYLLVSHIHVDHAGASGRLLEHLPNAKLLVHHIGAPHLVDPQKLWMQTKEVLGEVAVLYGGYQPVPKERIIAAMDGIEIDLGAGIALEVLETPGHASHALSFYEAASQGIFTGDSAGIHLPKLDVAMPTTPLPFHLEKTLSSLKRLMEKAPEQLFYSHFGPAEDALGKLKAYVDQLKLWSRIIADAVDAGEDFDTIYRKVLDVDPAMKKASRLLTNHPVWREIKSQDVHGFIGYFKRHPKR